MLSALAWTITNQPGDAAVFAAGLLLVGTAMIMAVRHRR